MNFGFGLALVFLPLKEIYKCIYGSENNANLVSFAYEFFGNFGIHCLLRTYMFFCAYCRIFR